MRYGLAFVRIMRRIKDMRLGVKIMQNLWSYLISRYLL